MPIIFDQPAPMAPGIVAAGAAAQQFSRDMPSLAGLYETAMRTATEASAQGAAISQRAAADYGRNYNAATADEGDRQLRGEMFTAQQQPSARDLFMANQQMQMQQQHAQLAAWTQGQELSQREVMRLQQLKQAVGTVDEQQQNGQITPEEADQYKMMLKSGIDPLDQRLKAAKVQQQQQVAAAMMHQNAQQTSMEGMDSAQRAKQFETRTIPATDNHPAGWLDHKGDFQPFEKGGKAGAEKPIDYMAATQHAESALKAEEAAAMKADTSYKPLTGDERRQRITDMVRGSVQAVKDLHAADQHSADLERQDKAAQAKGLEKRYDPTTGQVYYDHPRPTPPNQPRPMPQAIPAPEARRDLAAIDDKKPDEPEKPFRLNDPSSMAPGQSILMKQLGDFRAAQRDPRAVAAVDLVANFYANFGTVNPDKLKKRGATDEQMSGYHNAANLVRSLRKVAATQAAPMANDAPLGSY